MQMAELASTRATCLRRKVGSVAVVDKVVVATGYNGAPSGAAHCEEIGCLRRELNVPSGERHELCRAVHAEQNLLAQAARRGGMVCGGTVYVTISPCAICAKLLVQAGIRRVVFRGSYPDKMAAGILADAGVVLNQIKEGERGE